MDSKRSNGRSCLQSSCYHIRLENDLTGKIVELAEGEDLVLLAPWKPRILLQLHLPFQSHESISPLIILLLALSDSMIVISNIFFLKHVLERLDKCGVAHVTKLLVSGSKHSTHVIGIV